MTQRLRCPACDKLLVIQVASPNLKVLCPACGTLIPMPVAGSSLRSTLRAVVGPTQASDEAARAFSVRLLRRQRFPLAATVIASGVAVLVVGGLVGTVLLNQHSTADMRTTAPVRVARAAPEPAKPDSVSLSVLKPQNLPSRAVFTPGNESTAETRPTTTPAPPAAEEKSDFEFESPALATTAPVATQPVVTDVSSNSLSARTPASPDSGGPNPVSAAASRGVPGVSDAEIGHAIRRGVDFLLKNFQDGEISSDVEYVDSQKQALDALCVYALVQSSQAIDDDRLNLHGQLLPQLIEKLKAYDLVSDGKVTNRPITYGRSLRAAALATYARPQDLPVLKGDVAWLIQAQIGGAYTYDDLYTQMMAQGELPSNGPSNPPPVVARPPAQAPPDGNSNGSARMPPPQGGGAVTPPMDDDVGGDLPGGSPAPPVNPGQGPYSPPPSSPPPYVPPPMPVAGSAPPNAPRPQGGGGSGRLAQEVLPSHAGPAPGALPQPPMHFPRPVADFPRIMRIHVEPRRPSRLGSSGGGGGKPGGTSSMPGGYGQGGNIPIPESKLPPLQLTFDFPWDNSNSQYGLLGVWAGAEVGMEVPDAYWKLVEQHWLGCELRTGQWAYHKNEVQGYLAMTCAGVASLLVTHDYLDGPALRGAVGRPPYSSGLAAGIAWMGRGDNAVNIPNPQTHFMGYDLFGVERVGLASGYKYFGSHDWYRELSKRIVPMQWPNGAWGHEDHGVESIVDTAYSLLFLARGRHPVIMTKLKFGKSWDNRPRDVANLARWAGRELERPLNWQVVGIEHPWYDWFDSPVLYIASHEPPDFKEVDYLKLRNFVQAGGLIFTHADGGSPTFNRWVSELAKKIAPDYELKPLAENHPIYSLQYKLAAHVTLQGVSNGVRLLLVHSAGDLANAWQQRSTKTRRDHFQLGTNIFLYASGKPDLRNRLDSPFIPPPPNAPTRHVRIARVTYDGNWDPEPAAWQRFARYFQWESAQAADVTPVAAKELSASEMPVAALTGTGAARFADTDSAALRKYVEDGGVLLIDACGGENAFTQTTRDTLLRGAFSGAQKLALKPDHPLFKDLKPGLANPSPLRLRPYAIERLGQLAPEVQFLKFGKGYVVFSALDVTSGLLGTNTWGIVGYAPASAEKFVCNLVLWAQERS